MKTVLKILRNLILICLVLVVLAIVSTYAIVYVGTSKYQYGYVDVVEKNAKEYGLDPLMVMAVIRTESDFDPEAASPAGAKGLMQLRDETAEWCCKHLDIEFKSDQLLNPEYNVKLGCYYLSYLIGHYQNFDLAFAAYNAGTTTVDDWLSSGKISREKESLSAIPYEETRNYVVKINRAMEVYERFYGDKFPPESQKKSTLVLAFRNWVRLVADTIQIFG